MSSNLIQRYTLTKFEKKDNSPHEKDFRLVWIHWLDKVNLECLVLFSQNYWTSSAVSAVTSVLSEQVLSLWNQEGALSSWVRSQIKHKSHNCDNIAEVSSISPTKAKKSQTYTQTAIHSHFHECYEWLNQENIKFQNTLLPRNEISKRNRNVWWKKSHPKWWHNEQFFLNKHGAYTSVQNHWNWTFGNNKVVDLFSTKIPYLSASIHHPRNWSITLLLDKY